MIALRRLWRWRADGRLETVEPGGRCDWAAGGPYEQLGWCARMGAVLPPGSPPRDESKPDGSRRGDTRWPS